MIHGLAVIRSYQPFHQGPDAWGHPLAVLNRFSNTDKHRQLFELLSAPAEDWVPTLNLKFDGVLKRKWMTPEFDLPLRRQVKIAELEFEHPLPPHVRATINVRARPAVGCPPFPPQYPKGHVIGFGLLKQIILCVNDVTDRLSRL